MLASVRQHQQEGDAPGPAAVSRAEEAKPACTDKVRAASTFVLPDVKVGDAVEYLQYPAEDTEMLPTVVGSREDDMQPYPQVGDPAPALELPTETGDVFSLDTLRGRPTLVTFLSHAA